MTRAADLRFVQLGALALRPNRLEESSVLEELLQRREQAPELLTRARLVLDLARLPPTENSDIRLQRLVDSLARNDFPVMGLVAGPGANAAAALLGLPIVGTAAELRLDRSAGPAPTPSAPSPTMHIDGQVRSGQQLYARDRDLVVAGSVSPGAELIADGSIHVYGSLRGRALAGAGGNEEARVFSLDFQAELVAVAGHYKVFEELSADLRGQRVQAWLDAGQLKLARLGH